MRRKLAVFGLVVFGLCLAAQLTVVKLHLPNGPPRTITIHFELPIPPSIWDASAVLLTVPALAVLLLAAFCHRSLGPATTVPHGQDQTERDLELGNFAGNISPEGQNASTQCPEIIDAHASPRQLDEGVLPGGLCRPSYLQPPGASWTALREKSRGMISLDWSESFDKASGFGGTVRHGSLEEHPDLDIVPKEMFRDSEDEELFKEVAVGLLIPSSPYLGFATTIDRVPRLISACLPFTARGYWEQGLTLIQQRDLAIGMVFAILHLHYLSLVHCDIKPDNFLVDAEALCLSLILAQCHGRGMYRQWRATLTVHLKELYHGPGTSIP